jgi:hypothetical protein
MMRAFSMRSAQNLPRLHIHSPLLESWLLSALASSTPTTRDFKKVSSYFFKFALSSSFVVLIAGFFTPAIVTVESAMPDVDLACFSADPIICMVIGMVCFALIMVLEDNFYKAEARLLMSCNTAFETMQCRSSFR